MSINLTNDTWLTLVADAGTPEGLVGYAGVRLLLDADDLPKFPAPGVVDDLVTPLGTVPGYWRPAVLPGNSGYEWVMSAGQDPVQQALDAIPGPDGWQSPTARTAAGEVGGKMLAQGYSLGEAQFELTKMYGAAVENFVTAHPQ